MIHANIIHSSYNVYQHFTSGSWCLLFGFRIRLFDQYLIVARDFGLSQLNVGWCTCRIWIRAWTGSLRFSPVWSDSASNRRYSRSYLSPNVSIAESLEHATKAPEIKLQTCMFYNIWRQNAHAFPAVLATKTSNGCKGTSVSGSRAGNEWAVRNLNHGNCYYAVFLLLSIVAYRHDNIIWEDHWQTNQRRIYVCRLSKMLCRAACWWQPAHDFLCIMLLL